MSGRSSRTPPRRAELSQHFLREERALRLVQVTSIDASDVVIEIGAGRGALTRPLAKRTPHLTAVELDPFLADKLRRQLAGTARVLVGDFLRIALPVHPYKVVGNIPYAISTDIVQRLVTAPTPPQDAWLVVQREFAWRLCGRPYSPETMWSLRLKPRWHVEILERLQRTDFVPPPSVESVLLWLCRRDRPLLSGRAADLYDEILSAAYQRGPVTVKQALRPWLSKLQLRRLGHDLKFELDGPAAVLMFEQWLGITRFVSAAPGPPDGRPSATRPAARRSAADPRRTCR